MSWKDDAAREANAARPPARNEPPARTPLVRQRHVGSTLHPTLSAMAERAGIDHTETVDRDGYLGVRAMTAAHRASRPQTEPTREMIEKMRQILITCPFETTCADYFAIPRAEFSSWKERGEQAEAGLCYEFAKMLRTARAECEVSLILAIRKADKGWQSKGWLAERAFRDHWAYTQKVEALTKEQAKRLSEETGISAEDLIREAERIAAGA